MYYLETEHLDGNHYRISWNGSATYNLQIPIGGQWVDIECFTCYEYGNPNDAFNFALDWMLENLLEEEGEEYMENALETIYETEVRGTLGFAQKVNEQCGYQTSIEIVQAISEIAETAERFNEIWEAPSDEQKNIVIQKASELSDEEELFWGIELITE